MKTLTSIQLVHRTVTTEARLRAEQQQLLLLTKGLRDAVHLSKADLLDLLFRVRRNYNGGKYDVLLYKLLRRAIVDRLIELRRRL